MKHFSKLSFLLLLTGLLFVSCDRDNLDETIVPDPGFEPEVVVVNNLINALTTTTNEGYELGCLSIDYPFELLLEDGGTIEVFTDEELEIALDQETPFQVVDFIYPLTVTTEDGESIQVNSNEELAMLFASCIPEDGWDDTTTVSGNMVIPAFLFEELCFDLVYPVNLQDADDNEYVAVTEAALIDLIITTPSLAFTLPLTVTDENGEEVIIESVAEFYSLYYDCDGNTAPGTEGGILIDFSELDGDCEFEDLSIQFPYDILTEDGESITLENENQEAALILSGVHYTIVYPFNLVDADGTVVTINDELQFIELILPCFIEIGVEGPCDGDAHVGLFFNAHNIFTVYDCPFEINYPVDVIIDGTPTTLNNVNDYFNETGAPSSFGDVDLVYPITVTVEADGSTVELNSDQDVCDFLLSCD